jgi:hypothetical protein
LLPRTLVAESTRSAFFPHAHFAGRDDSAIGRDSEKPPQARHSNS